MKAIREEGRSSNQRIARMKYCTEDEEGRTKAGKQSQKARTGRSQKPIAVAGRKEKAFGKLSHAEVRTKQSVGEERGEKKSGEEDERTTKNQEKKEQGQDGISEQEMKKPRRRKTQESAIARMKYCTQDEDGRTRTGQDDKKKKKMPEEKKSWAKEEKTNYGIS